MARARSQSEIRGTPRVICRLSCLPKSLRQSCVLMMCSDWYTANAPVTASVGKRGAGRSSTRGSQDEDSEALPGKVAFTGSQSRSPLMTLSEAMFIDLPTGEFLEC